jgi:hypothetical protein
MPTTFCGKKELGTGAKHSGSGLLDPKNKKPELRNRFKFTASLKREGEYAS